MAYTLDSIRADLSALGYTKDLIEYVLAENPIGVVELCLQAGCIHQGMITLINVAPEVMIRDRRADMTRPRKKTIECSPIIYGDAEFLNLAVPEENINK